MAAMQHTRWEILQILKRSGRCTVEELAHALSFAPMTVRQHLAILERDGLVSANETRKGLGRPSYLYSTTPQAEDLFPKGYDRLAERLLREVALLTSDEIAHLSEREKVTFVFQRMAERQATEYGEEIQGETVEERGAQVAALLREREGTLSEWVSTKEGYLIQDCNCPFQKIAVEEPAICGWHVHLLARMLRAEVHMESCLAEGDSCCRYRIQAAPNSWGQQGQLPLLPMPAVTRSRVRR